MAVDFVDRYLSVKHDIAKQRLQLVGTTALFIAAKLEVRIGFKQLLLFFFPRKRCELSV